MRDTPRPEPENPATRPASPPSPPSAGMYPAYPPPYPPPPGYYAMPGQAGPPAQPPYANPYVYAGYAPPPPGSMPPPPGSMPPYGAPAVRAGKRIPVGRILLFVGLALAIVIAGTAGILFAITAPSGRTTTWVPAPTPTEDVVATSGISLTGFQDPLTTNANGWPTGTYCSFQGGMYHVITTGPRIIAAFCPTPKSVGTYSDLDLQVTARLVSGQLADNFGLAFRWVGVGSFYVFVVNGNGHAWFGKESNWSAQRLSDVWSVPAFARGVGHPNTLRVVGQGSNFAFYMNGQHVGSWSDGTYPTGHVGLFAGSPNVDAGYSNFAVDGSQ